MQIADTPYPSVVLSVFPMINITCSSINDSIIVHSIQQTKVLGCLSYSICSHGHHPNPFHPCSCKKFHCFGKYFSMSDSVIKHSVLSSSEEQVASILFPVSGIRSVDNYFFPQETDDYNSKSYVNMVCVIKSPSFAYPTVQYLSNYGFGMGCKLSSLAGMARLASGQIRQFPSGPTHLGAAILID